MQGWKTKLGGTGMICTGVGFVIAGLLSDPVDGTKIGEGFALIGLGWTGLGLGHKIEKAGK